MTKKPIHAHAPTTDTPKYHYCDRCGMRLEATGEHIGGEFLCAHCANVARDPTSRNPIGTATSQATT